MRTGVDADRRVVHYDLTVFQLREGAWNRMDLRLEQTWYREEEIEAALARAGFTDTRLTYSGDAGPETARKVYVVCRRAGPGTEEPGAARADVRALVRVIGGGRLGREWSDGCSPVSFG